MHQCCTWFFGLKLYQLSYPAPRHECAHMHECVYVSVCACPIYDYLSLCSLIVTDFTINRSTKHFTLSSIVSACMCRCVFMPAHIYISTHKHASHPCMYVQYTMYTHTYMCLYIMCVYIHINCINNVSFSSYRFLHCESERSLLWVTSKERAVSEHSSVKLNGGRGGGGGALNIRI